MIDLKEITKTIGEREILKDFSLSVSEGELVAITGKSGSGKSTLLNIIGLIDGDYQGEYRILGQEQVKVHSAQAQKLIRENISYLFQNFALIDTETVNYNLLLALKYVPGSRSEKLEKIQQILTKVGLPHVGKQKVAELSGGEQQRVAVARAILKPSCLVLADEPTGSLDLENRDLVLQFLLEMNQAGKTIIVVTHDPYIAAHCHRVVELGG